MMTEINLLPWREERRQAKQREFIMMLVGAVIVGFAVWWLWGQAVSANINDQTARNQFIEKRIAKLDKKIQEISELKKQRQELISRMKVIQDLQGNRPNIVHIFDQLVRTLPDGVYYTSVKRSGKSFTIKGVAENNNQISNLMRNLDESPWFQMPTLKTVVAKGANANGFTLTVQQSSPDADKKKGGDK